MAWDKTTPTVLTKIKDSPTIFTENWDALEIAISEEHEAIDSVGMPGQHMAGKCAVMMYGTQSQILAISSTTPCAVALDTGRLDLCYNNGTVWVSAGGVIPVGTKMFFYQDTAPTGWTIDNTLDDKLLFVTQGSPGGQTGGGAHSTGSWTITGFGGASDSHAVTIAEMPSHLHTIPWTSWVVGLYSSGFAVGYVASNTTGSTGGGGGHTHNISSALTQSGAWRPAAYCCIICTKD